MAKKKQDTLNKGISNFEEDLLWTSLRYCIGTHSYMLSFAYDIAKNLYYKLSDNQKRKHSKEIRKEIYRKFNFGRFHIDIHRVTSEDPLNVIQVIMDFIKEYNINSYKELNKYNSIEYDANSKKFINSSSLSTPIEPSYYPLSYMEINDFIVWETLASLLDIDNHKIIKLKDGEEVEAFKTFMTKKVPLEDNPRYYRQADFGWDEVWIPVDMYVTKSQYYYIPEEDIKCVN